MVLPDDSEPSCQINVLQQVEYRPQHGERLNNFDEVEIRLEQRSFSPFNFENFIFTWRPIDFVPRYSLFDFQQQFYGFQSQINDIQITWRENIWIQEAAIKTIKVDKKIKVQKKIMEFNQLLRQIIRHRNFINKLQFQKKNIKFRKKSIKVLNFCWASNGHLKLWNKVRKKPQHGQTKIWQIQNQYLYYAFEPYLINNFI